MNPPVDPAAQRILVLEPGRAQQNYWRDLWAYRDLFAILAWRDVTVQYKQTIIGVTWAVARPVLIVVVLTTVFGRLAKLPSDGATPYLLVVFAGMLPWLLFSTILGAASNSLIGNATLIGKVYFPRIIIPVSSAFVALIDFAINLLLLLGLMVWYGFNPQWRFMLLPCFIVMTVLASLGPALILATLNVKYRDFRFLVPFIIQFGVYVSPIGFSSAAVPREWRFWYSLNPVVGLVDGFRWCLLGGESRVYFPGFFISLAVVGLLLWIGIVYFRRAEKTFADVI